MESQSRRSPSHRTCSTHLAIPNMTTANIDTRFEPANDDDTILAAIQTQQSLVASFDDWLTQRMKADGNGKSVVSRVQRRLGSYKSWLLEIGRSETHVPETTEDPGPWSMGAKVEHVSEGHSVVVVTGPGLDEPIQLALKDRQELENLMSVCQMT